MPRLYAANLVLFGILIGVLVSSACGNGLSASANNGPTEVVIAGILPGVDFPVRIDAADSSPVAVMICDGQDQSGVCATVYESNGGENVLMTY